MFMKWPSLIDAWTPLPTIIKEVKHTTILIVRFNLAEHTHIHARTQTHTHKIPVPFNDNLD